MRKIVLAVCLFALAGSAAARPIPDEEAGHCPKAATCGIVVRPLDPSGRVKGTVPIAYRFYPHLDQGLPLAGTIVSQEGGPGYSTQESSYGYLALFAPLRQDHDMLMIDARGTGKSDAVRCPSVQHSPVRKPADIGACGQFLGNAADLYGTKLAADDMAAVLDSLHIGKIDYYGDSYGTFFGQVFSALYPDRLRSVVLDSAYPVIGETPWYSHAGDVVRAGFNEACKRSAYCASLEGSSLNRIRKLVDYLRQHPLSGRAPDGEGKMHHVVVDPGMVGLMLFDGTEGPINYRELDAAIRALFDGNDAQPMLRLASENIAGEYPQPPKSYSYGLFSAVSCMDYQQIYDMNSPIAERHRQRDAAVARKKKKDPRNYDPLTFAEFQAVPLDISVLNLCLDWPIKQPPYEPGKPIPDGAKMTDAPTLVLNGELDMLTTAAEGAIVTAQYPHGKQVVVANSFHVVAVDDYNDCAMEIVRRFVATLDTGDTSCAANIDPVRLVPLFVKRADDAIPATPDPGNTASTRDLAVASAAAQTAADVLARWNINYGGNGLGLRGGSWSYTQPDLVARFALDATLWCADLPVSGSVVWDQRDGSIRAKLTYLRQGETAELTAVWNDRDHNGIAKLSGTIGARVIQATMPAP
jgi:pimeloyl-ACP methyl ester carboxylesterase